MNDSKINMRSHNMSLFIKAANALLLFNEAKSIFTKGFCENVHKLIICPNKFNSYVPFLNVLSNKVMCFFNFSSKALDQPVTQVNAAHVVAIHRNLFKEAQSLPRFVSS